MEHISALGFLDADPRPACVIDLHQVGRDTAHHVHAQNKALLEQPKLLHDALYSNHDEALHGARARLRKWATDTTQDAAKKTYVESLDGHQVYGFTVQERWRILQWQPAGSIVDEPLASAPAQDLLEPEPPEHAPTDAKAKLASMAAVIDMIDVGFYEYDMEGKLIRANDAFYMLSGHPKVSHDELPEYSFADCLFDEDRDMVFSHWIMLTQGTSTTFEMRWRRAGEAADAGEGSELGQWVLAACVPTRNQDGVITSISGCITDINAQKRNQRDALERAEALERAYASERRFGRFCEFANVPIVIVDTNLQVSFCNREWFSIIGHPVVEYKDINWAPYIAPEDLVAVQGFCETVLRTRKPTKFQFRLRRTWSNGQGGTGPAWLMACAYPEMNDDGTVMSIAATHMDISYLKWAESVQKQRTEEALEAKRQQENFIDFTCHEVRNPLSAVIHCADLIESALVGMVDVLGSVVSQMPQRKRFDGYHNDIADAVATIMSCSTHQKRIMDDILTLSKLDSKLLTISPAAVRLDGILKDAEKMFALDAKNVGVSWRVVDDSDRALGITWAMLDAGRLMQILINLITNALKFTQNEDSRTVTLSMRASRSRLSEHELGVEFVPVSTMPMQERSGHTHGKAGQEIYVYFVVRDTGCGFGEEQKARIFERFAQASPRTHSQYGGSGLGLFITRELIELQGGEIGVSSHPGKGATFTFYITARALEAPRTGVPTPRKPSVDPIPAYYNILVVEDNLGEIMPSLPFPSAAVLTRSAAVNQKVLRKQLEKLGHQVDVVSHGGEALSYLETTSCWEGNTDSPKHVEIILMDIEMPVMDGITCARKIREAQGRGAILGRLPIIAVSANARYEQMKQAMAAGMDDAISKPFRVAELIPKIERLVTAGQATEVG